MTVEEAVDGGMGPFGPLREVLTSRGARGGDVSHKNRTHKSDRAAQSERLNAEYEIIGHATHARIRVKRV